MLPVPPDLCTVVAIVFGPQTSDGPIRIELSAKPCPKVCGRASEVWSGARSARHTLGICAYRVVCGRSARSKKDVQKKHKNGGAGGGRISAGMSERASALDAHKQ
jgi:hypothetical protein